jgi:hypothetical protein
MKSQMSCHTLMGSQPSPRCRIMLSTVPLVSPYVGLRHGSLKSAATLQRRVIDSNERAPQEAHFCE